MRAEKNGGRLSSDAAGGITISVIVPCWNDEEALRQCLADLRGLRGIFEIIVADASDNGDCVQAAEETGATLVRCAKPNRGAQMNAGANCASGTVLLFHHADSSLTQPHVDSLHGALEDSRIAGGAFHRKFDGRHERLRWLEPIVRVSSTLGGTLYGDQSIFVRHDRFLALGGYAEIPLMEDIEFSKRLRRAGCVAVLDPPMHSSPRKAARRGTWRTTIENACLILLYRLGASPHRLHRWYYRQRTPAADLTSSAGSPR